MRLSPSVSLVTMGLCALLFLGRVYGQIFVGLYGPAWLPPMEEWYSGLLPYPYLLLTQFFILMIMPLMFYGAARRNGLFFVESARIRTAVSVFSVTYFTVMVARYGIVMFLYPERRWLSGTIPIFLHWVLALFLFLWANHGRTAPTASHATSTG